LYSRRSHSHLHRKRRAISRRRGSHRNPGRRQAGGHHCGRRRPIHKNQRHRKNGTRFQGWHRLRFRKTNRIGPGLGGTPLNLPRHSHHSLWESHIEIAKVISKKRGVPCQAHNPYLAGLLVHFIESWFRLPHFCSSAALSPHRLLHKRKNSLLKQRRRILHTSLPRRTTTKADCFSVRISCAAMATSNSPRRTMSRILAAAISRSQPVARSRVTSWAATSNFSRLPARH